MVTAEDLFYEQLLPKTKMAEEAKPEAPAPGPKTIGPKSLFSHPDTHPVVLDLTLIKHFQLEWLTWLPETLFSEIEKTFSTSIAEVNRLKILATQTLHVTDAFWDQWEIFEKTIAALNGVVPLPRVLQPPDLSFLLAGVDMADQVRSESYGEEVARYCAAVFLHEGVHYAPEPLEFCQPYLTQPMYECLDCGKKSSALPPFDQLCTSCAGYYTHEHPLAQKPDPEAVKKGKGKRLRLYNMNDPASVKARFEVLDKFPHDKISSEIKEVPDDIEAARLIIANDYRMFKTRQLRDQLSSLQTWLETS
jgi:hypothetical protein